MDYVSSSETLYSFYKNDNYMKLSKTIDGILILFLKDSYTRCQISSFIYYIP